VVLCSEVLEHLPRPDRAIAELRRVLKPQGTLVLTVPFLRRHHAAPHDYFRFTEHGLRRLLEEAHLSVEELRPIGSVFGFLGHQVSSVIVVGSFGIPLIRLLVFWLNAALIVLPCFLLDHLSGLMRKLPLGYVLVARKAAG
jgi:SAM-dependent methyltransferase